MKYWDELNELETSIIELDIIKSNLRVVTNGMESSQLSDVQLAFEHIASCLESKMNEVSDNFQYLFATIRSDNFDEETISTLKTNEYVQPSEVSLELDSIVRGWSKA